jgi:hypothetical protein
MPIQKQFNNDGDSIRGKEREREREREILRDSEIENIVMDYTKSLDSN